MKKLLLSLFTVLSLTVFAQDGKIITDANAVSRTLNGSFTAIDVSSGVELHITKGSTESIAVSANNEKHLERFKTEVVNGVLKIYYDNKSITWKSEAKRLKAYVSYKTLERLHASAGSEVKVNGDIEATDFKLTVSSGAEFTGAIQATNLVADVSSGANAKVSGKADKLTIEVSSGADFKAYDLVVDYCDASASSGAAVHVTINKELNAKASSGADIKFKGTGLIRDIKTSSGGAVKKA